MTALKATNRVETDHLSIDSDDAGMTLDELISALRGSFGLLVLIPLAVGGLALGASYFVAPTFIASTSFLPPQQSQSAAVSALSSLGPLAGLAGTGAGARNSGDQFVALMQSATISNNIVDRFDLMKAYKAELRVDARNELGSRVVMSVGKKDGLIVLDVNDTDPVRAAAIANAYVDELRTLTSKIDVTEAQQRRTFFAAQLELSRDKLTKAQQVLQASGFNPGALRAEPKAAVENYVRLKAEAGAIEIRLQALRQSLAESTPEIQRELAVLRVLNSQLAQSEQPATGAGPDYIGRYREFRYQETLFEMFARQYELARVDEAKEGTLIQVIDLATPPERKSKPKRLTITIGASIGAAILMLVWVLLRASHSRQIR